MGRVLTFFGLLITAAGVFGGGTLIYVRRTAFVAASQARTDFLAPLKWQASLGTGIALIVLGLVLGLIMIGLGRVLHRLDAVQRLLARAEPAHDPVTVHERDTV